MAVDGAHHHVLPLPPVVSPGATEEVEDEDIDNRRDYREDGGDGDRGHKEPYDRIERRKHKEEEDEYVGAFSMNLHVMMTFVGLEIASLSVGIRRGEAGAEAFPLF